MRSITLGKLFKITSGGTPSKSKPEYYENGTVPWVKTGDLKSKYINESSDYITEEAVNNSSAKLFPKNTVLIAMYGATIGATSILKIDATTNQACAAFLPSNGILPEYLYYFFKVNNRKIISLGVGGAQPNISATILKSIKISLPSLETQKKIVEVLEKAERAIDKRKEQIGLVDELVKSKFIEMFGDPSINPKGWEKGKIADIVIRTQYGTSTKADEQNGEFKVLRMNNITYDGHWDFSSMKYVDLNEKDKEKYLVYKGQVLFNRTNSKELVGKTAVYKEIEPMAYAGYLVKAIPNERATGEFIAAYMNTKYVKEKLFNMAKNIVGMANINAEEFKKIDVYIPPIELQHEYIRFVEQVDKLKFEMENSLKELENNFNSLMQRAFRGELFS